MTAKRKKGFYEKFIKLPQDGVIALFALLIAGAALLDYDTLLNISSDIIYELEDMN